MFRSKRLEAMKKHAYKKKRMEKKFSQLKRDESDARTAKSKRDGTYRRGMNLDDVTDETKKKRNEERMWYVLSVVSKATLPLVPNVARRTPIAMA